MTFRAKLPFLISTVIIIVCSSYFLSKNTPFTGDEFYTLDIEKIHKPLPYKVTISQIIEIYSPIISENIFGLRFTSILFTLLSIILWYLYFIRDKYEAIVFSTLIITSSFLLQETIYFRYYSYYFLSSTITFLCLIQLAKKLNTNQKLLVGFIGILFSPYLFYILNALQFAFYFVYIFLFEKIQNIKLRLTLFMLPLFFIVVIAIKPKIIWTFFNWLNIIGHANIDMTANIVHGINKSVIIKPFYAFYQIIFGYDIAPTSSIVIFLFYILVLILITYQLYNIFIDNKDLFLQYTAICIVPFLMIYLFFQVISLPGFTQLETKHGMLIYPMIISLVVKAPKYGSPLLSYLFFGIIFISQLIGMQSTYIKNNTDWNLITDKVNNYLKDNNNQKILMDGRSMETFNFYNKNLDINEMISYTWEPIDSLEYETKDKERLVLLLNDYKSYTPLTIQQNWNAGVGSLNRVKKLNMILKRVNKGYFLDDSYISYPTFLYLFTKKIDRTDNVISAGVWQHHLKDLRLPIKSDKKNDILSSIIIQPGDSVEVISDSILVFNLEKSKNIKYGDLVGTISINGNVINLIKGVNIWDVFAEFHDTYINENKVFHSWYHKPLVSGSIKYFGSYFKHKAHIYSLGLGKKNDNKIKILNNNEISSIRIWN